MTDTTIRVREPREMLAYLPHQIGFTPEESLVLVSLRPPRGRVGLVLRVDLVDLADEVAGPRVARSVVGHLGRDGAAAAWLAVWTAQDPRRDPDAPGAARCRRAVAHAHAALAALGLGEPPVWVVTRTGYLALDCREPECCPPGGRWLGELTGSRAAAQLAYTGSAVSGSRDGLARVVPAPAERRRAVARVVGRRLARRPTTGDDPALREWRAESLAAWRDLVAATAADREASPPVIGRVVAGLSDSVVRDAVLLALVPDTGTLPDRLLVDPPGTHAGEVGRVVARLLDAGAGVPPPSQAGDRHRRALDQVVAHARAGELAPARTLQAVLAWWRGAGGHAAVLLRQALADQQGYRLAAMLDVALASGLAPGWVRAEAREFASGATR